MGVLKKRATIDQQHLAWPHKVEKCVHFLRAIAYGLCVLFDCTVRVADLYIGLPVDRTARDLL